MEFPYKKNGYIYLDNASTSQKPNSVIEAINEYNKYMNANAGRASYDLSYNSTKIMENCRDKIKKIYNADSYDVVFTKNATESINLLAYTYGFNLEENDEIIIATNNHHSNIVIWQYLRDLKRIKLKYIKIDDKGAIDLEHLKEEINDKTKLITISHIVNTTGVENNILKIKEIVKDKNIKILLDISQTVAHRIIDFKEIDADFYVFSAHKMFGPQGLGLLVGKKEILNSLPPFLYGGDMIEYVNYEKSTFKESPYKFEGGTQNISSIYGFLKSLDFLQENIENIQKIEKELLNYTLEKLKKLDFIEIYNGQKEIPIIAFNVKNIHSHDIASILNEYKIAIRTGKHCTSLLMEELKINSCCRVSFSIYNSKEEIDKFINVLIEINKMFNAL